MQISKQHLLETEVHVFSAEASELGFPVGKIPTTLEVKEKIGNGMFFYLIKATAEMFTYWQEGGCIRIEVYND